MALLACVHRLWCKLQYKPNELKSSDRDHARIFAPPFRRTKNSCLSRRVGTCAVCLHKDLGWFVCWWCFHSTSNGDLNLPSCHYTLGCCCSFHNYGCVYLSMFTSSCESGDIFLNSSISRWLDGRHLDWFCSGVDHARRCHVSLNQK